jgi:hypothetical protein
MEASAPIDPPPSVGPKGRYLGWRVRYWIISGSAVFAVVLAWGLFGLFFAHGQPWTYPASIVGWTALLAGLVGEALFLTAIALLVLEAYFLLKQARRTGAKTA